MKLIAALLVAPLLFGANELSGRRAPGFSLPDTTFRQHDLYDYRGRVVLLEVMQTRCPHCNQLSVELERIKTKYAGKVAIIAITNPPDSLNTVNDFIAKNNVTYPVLFDCGQASASYLKATPQNPSVSVPHLFVIDAQGNIKEDYGHADIDKLLESKSLDAAIDRVLAPVKK